MTLSKAERAERDAEKQALAQSKANHDEWDQLVKDADKHTAVVCDLIGSTLAEEREHLSGRLRDLFMKGAILSRRSPTSIGHVGSGFSPTRSSSYRRK